MPKLGMAMKKGKLKRWLRAEGETVEAGSDLLEIITEKVNAVVPAPASGILGRVVAGPDTELPVGSLLALIGEPGDVFPPREVLVRGAATPATRIAAAPSEARPAQVTLAPSPEGILASPAARRRARELGIDLSLVPPTAPGKRLTVDDVEAFAAAPVAAGAPPSSGAETGVRVTPFAGIRRVAAERLTESLQTMAQVTISREAVVSGLVTQRQQLAPEFEAATGIRLTYTDLLVETVARLLIEHPMLNSTLGEKGILTYNAVHMGVAVALEDGLIVPVIRNAHTKSLGEIARDRVDLTAKAHAGTLSLDEVEGGTFTISNLGAFGADVFTPIINPPQCAILGVGRIIDKPVVVDSEVKIRPLMWLSLTFDHRLLDGAPATRFLNALAERLA